MHLPRIRVSANAFSSTHPRLRPYQTPILSQQCQTFESIPELCYHYQDDQFWDMLVCQRDFLDKKSPESQSEIGSSYKMIWNAINNILSPKSPCHQYRCLPPHLTRETPRGNEQFTSKSHGAGDSKEHWSTELPQA